MPAIAWQIVKWVGNALLLGGTSLVAIFPETAFAIGFAARLAGDACWIAASLNERAGALLFMIAGFAVIDLIGVLR